ncbi:ABC transporter ATP-binding protein [Maricurvus nonylphenolicus]|uniref:ABC transporter ATP-binding protein n=1 Tax=Maricurvus nonylphenolicus TaxID=1008307 RepID=UPI0036F37D0D
MIEVRQLSKRFGNLLAVDNLSFTVKPGEVLGFLGPNGAGKSTTMKMITGFLTPDHGSVIVHGHDVIQDPLAVKQLIGYLPEGAPSYEEMSVAGFLKFVAQVRDFRGAEIDRRVAHVVELLQLESVLKKTIETLSKGFKRRVGLAQALIHDPDILILDEPTDGLDPNQKHQVREIIRNLASNKIVIISTHILEEVEALCQRAIIIDRGKLVADDTPIALQRTSEFYQAVHLYLAEPVADINALATVAGVKSVVTDVNDASHLIVLPEGDQPIFEAVFAGAKDLGWKIHHVAVDEGRLDDVFRRVTTALPVEA